LSLWSDFHFLWCPRSVISNLSISSNVKHRVCSCRPWSMWQLYLSFKQRSNNSDRFVNLASHFICVQIFQIYFSLKSEKFLCPTSHCNFPIVQCFTDIEFGNRLHEENTEIISYNLYLKLFAFGHFFRLTDMSMRFHNSASAIWYKHDNTLMFCVQCFLDFPHTNY